VGSFGILNLSTTTYLLHKMPASLKTVSYPDDERIARIIWASHILFYLTKTQSHSKQHQDTGISAVCVDGDTNELSDSETDYETERTVILSGSRASVCEKFLDCIAQLLSPC
jgi:hypothetical protein